MNDNSENRNNMNTINTPRVNILRNIARNRRCSFCRDPNHTINFCNDVRLENFKNLCDFQKGKISISTICRYISAAKIIIGYLCIN